MVEVSQRMFTDHDAEAVFGISVSRLRTAQRYRLVDSHLAQVGSRFVRAWSTMDLLLVHLAQRIDEYLSVPFPVACQIVTKFRAGEQRAIEMSFSGAPAFDLLPRIIFTDRQVLQLDSPDGLMMIGCMERDPDKKNTFTEINGCDPAILEREPISRCMLHCDVIVKRFLAEHAASLA